MAKKIYNKNAREAHLLAEAYQNVLNEDGEREYDERGFVVNTDAGREDGNEPDNRNKGDTPWYDKKEVEDAEDTLTVGDIISEAELNLPLTPDTAEALQNVMDTVRLNLRWEQKTNSNL